MVIHGVISGMIIGAIKGDTRSLDYTHMMDPSVVGGIFCNE